jgi:bifunctional UDP-N-acetylglucosamine pyrophosphorylase/glucosamine-1-phosphate N-acetyltransferase
VAAGSVITDPVPPGALALGRAKQVTKEGWVERRNAAKKEEADRAKTAPAAPGKARARARQAG